MSSTTKPFVLLTGASGYVGSWVLYHLLETKHKVRATVRSSRVDEVRKRYPDAAEHLEVIAIEENATSDFSEAMKGIEALIHLGSPTPVSGQTTQTMYEGATKGLDNVMNAAIQAGVKKFVLTSSVGALHAPDMEKIFKDTILNEKDWGQIDEKNLDLEDMDIYTLYGISKVLCEKRFWKYADRYPELDFTSILPSMIYGGWIPNFKITKPEDSSCMVVYQLITGEPGKGPNSFPSWPFPQQVHAYDVARAHVKALATPPLKDGRKKRLIVSQSSFPLVKAIRLIKRERPELASRLPNEDDPAGAVYSIVKFDTSLTEEVLGIKADDHITAEKTWLDTIDQIVAWEKAKGK